MTLRVAVVGAGYMGTAHARVLRRISIEYPGLAETAYIVDINLERARYVAARYGGQAIASIKDIPEDSVDFAIIAVPTKHHLQAFNELVERGVRGFLVEKPLAAEIDEALELAEAAKSSNAWVAVGHIERFNPAVWILHRVAAEGRLGELLTLVARRVGPFAPRAGDTDVIYDLGIHEVDNALALWAKPPETIRAYTLHNIVTGLNDYALTVLGFREGFASLEVNRVTPFKQRTLYLTGSKSVAQLNYMTQELTLHTPDEEAHMKIPREEPLYLEDLANLAAYRKRKQPLVDINQGIAAMMVCAAALASTATGETGLEQHPAFTTAKPYIAKAVEGYRNYKEAVRKHTPRDYIENLLGKE